RPRVRDVHLDRARPHRAVRPRRVRRSDAADDRGAPGRPVRRSRTLGGGSRVLMTVHPHLLAAIERNRRRLWAISYRMTGRYQDADDLCQEAIARALERADQVAADDPTGWLIRIATNTCLDHLRRAAVRDRVTTLVDPLDLPELAPGERAGDPER